MSVLMPTGNVFNQGTYFGQVLVMHAAKAFLDLATDPSNWAHQERLSARLYQGLEDLFARYNAGRIQALGNRFSMLFGIHEPVWEYRQAAQIDKDLAFRFYKESFHHGVYFMHSWHHGYSWAHTEQDIDDALEGTEATLRRAVR